MKRKHEDEFEHFCRRMFERYGVTVGIDEWTDLNLAIQAGEAKLLDQEDDDQWIYEVEFGRDPVTIQVVYSNKRQTITTALPPRAWKCKRVPR